VSTAGVCLSSICPQFRNGTWVTPTLVAQYEVAVWPTLSVPGDSLAHYLPDTLTLFLYGALGALFVLILTC
jgi:hypothetical protein